MRPWLLLLLRGGPAHGYRLLKQLEMLSPAPDADPAFLYRTLHRFEREGLVRSAWRAGGSGPDRRVYHLTAEGAGALDRWAVRIRRRRVMMDRFLETYAARPSERTGEDLQDTGDARDADRGGGG
ncbi:MAG: PadR family transcriptional regulator [bacterium]